ncbi:MAG: transporter substrate-binding domain-containing protein [Rhodospirillales bacterium]|nr:transporter substrate-binding domain-containing protein [Rhodospirillales bacterium]
MKWQLIKGAALLSLAWGLVAGTVVPAMAGTFDKIKERGKLVVGVKSDYKPWGFIDAAGNLAGMEIDMAHDVAHRLGVKLELIPVQTANRIEFLQQGKIDLIIATMSDNPKRRETVGIIEPLYYAGGTNALLRKGVGVSSWQDVRGKKLCGTQGAYYNKRVAELYGAEIIAFAGNPEAMNALLGGNCIGFVQDSTFIGSTLASGDAKWADFEMTLPTEDEQGWGIAVPLAELNGPYGDFMRKVVTDWHRSGKLIDIERKWGIKASPFLQTMNKMYR